MKVSVRKSAGFFSVAILISLSSGAYAGTYNCRVVGENKTTVLKANNREEAEKKAREMWSSYPADKVMCMLDPMH